MRAGKSSSGLILACAVFAAANSQAALEWSQLAPLPDPIGVAGAFAGVSEGALVVAGGANFPNGMPWDGGKKVWHDDVWVLERREGAWRKAGPLPHPLGYGVSVSWSNGVICVGGSDAMRHHAEAFRLAWDGHALKREDLPALPMPLANGCGAIVDETVFVAGGSEEVGEKEASSRVFALDLGAKDLRWRELPPLPSGRILATAAGHDGTFYVIGGAALAAGKRVYLKEAWSFNTGSKTWKRLADLPKPSVAAASPAPIVEGRILMISGDDGEPRAERPGFEASIFAYDAAENRWIDAGKTPAPRVTLPCVRWGGMFVLPSGEVRPGVRSPEVWAARAKELK